MYIGECLAFLASGSDPTILKSAVICVLDTGEAGSSLPYVHMTYPDLLNFSMHEKNRTESQRGKYIHCILYACMRDSSTVLGQAPRRVSLFGGVYRQTLLPMHVS